MFGFKHGRLGSAGTRTLIQRAIASLRARGSDAHLWLPGGDVKTYGPELVVNGGFDSDTGWTKGTGWSIAGGVATHASGTSGAVNQASPIEAGRSYQCTVTVSGRTAGTWYWRLGNTTNLAASNSNGTFTQTLTGSATGSYIGIFGDPTFDGTIDNISVRGITSITPTITSGLTTGNYLESTGNTVATVNNPTGLVLDALGSVGAELVTNGGFDTDSGWTKETAVSIASGGLVFTATANGASGYQSFAPKANTLYKVVMEVESISSGGLYPQFFAGAASTAVTTVGTHTAYIKTPADVSNGNFGITANGTTTAKLSSISVREVSGIHLTQGTTSAKPLLRRGLTNLLTYSSDFSNAAWTKSSLTVTGSQADPNGGSSAYKLTPAALAAQHSASSTNVSAGTYTWAVIAKNTGYNLGISCYDGAYKVGSIFNLSSGTVTVSTAGSVSEILPLGAGWYLCTVTATLTASSSFGGFAVRPNIAGVSISEAVVGDGVSSVTVYRAGLFQGTLTASQILASGGIPVTTTAAASNPDSGKYSFRFDGSNDSLTLGSLPFGLADDHAFIVGAQSGQVGTSIALCGLYSSVANNPRLQMYIGSANNLSMQYRSDGGTSVAPALSPALANFTPFVGSMRKTGTSATLRQNGSLSTTVSVATVDVVTADRAVIGETKGSYMNGPIGPVLAIKGTVTDAELLMYERLVAALTPGAPSF